HRPADLVAYEVLEDPDAAGVWVDLDVGEVDPVRVRHPVDLEGLHGREAAGATRELREGHGSFRRPRGREPTARRTDIGRVHLERLGRRLAGEAGDPVCGEGDRVPGQDGRTTGPRSDALGDQVRISEHDRDVVGV